MKQLYVQLTQNPDKVENHTFIDRNVCEKCHASGTGPSKFNRVVETNGHKVHAGKARLQCVQCHSDSVHRFKPPKEICAGCHQSVTLKAAGTMAEMHCMQCHSFLAGMPEAKKAEPAKAALAKAAPKPVEAAVDYSKASFKPDRIACLDCHAQRKVKGEVFPAAKAPMAWDCGKCHKPHADRINIANADCVKCHNTITEGLHKVSAHANDCMSCHKPHSWSSGTASCATCHAKIDPVKHHPEKKTCTECHGAWDDSWVQLDKGGAATPAKGKAGK
jgi:hypothetical protein